MSIKYRKFLTGSTEFLTTSPNQTKKLGENMARRILKEKIGRKAKVIALVGDLGGGKTTFWQGFARGLRIKEKVLSPTFVIIKRYKIQDTKYKIQNFYHIDCYRIKNSKELLDLDFKKIISDPKNIIAVEWADRVRKIMPRETIWLKFEFINSNTRKIMLQ